MSMILGPGVRRIGIGKLCSSQRKYPMKSCELYDCALNSAMSPPQSSLSEAALYMLFLRQSRHSFPSSHYAFRFS